MCVCVCVCVHVCVRVCVHVGLYGPPVPLPPHLMSCPCVLVPDILSDHSQCEVIKRLLPPRQHRCVAELLWHSSLIWQQHTGCRGGGGGGGGGHVRADTAAQREARGQRPTVLPLPASMTLRWEDHSEGHLKQQNCSHYICRL